MYFRRSRRSRSSSISFGRSTGGLSIITWVIDSSDSSKGDPEPEDAGHPILPPQERTTNSNIGRDVSLDSQNVYGTKIFATVEPSWADSDWNVERTAASSGLDFEGCGTNSSSAITSSASPARFSVESSPGASDEIVLIVCRMSLADTFSSEVFLVSETRCSEACCRLKAPTPAAASSFFASNGGG
jgi:hypothetical protein